MSMVFADTAPMVVADTLPAPLDAAASVAQAAPQRFADEAVQQMERLVADLAQVYRERNEAMAEISRAHREALLRLTMAAEMRDDDTGQHLVRIGFLAYALALCLGERESFAAMLRAAAPMHDIGKIGIPDAVLKKPGPLTPQEREVIEQHPEIGAAILGDTRIPAFKVAAEVALAHHERWDGRGYPHGLAGEAIPLSARIVAVVDFFDALTMDRVYRKAMSDEVALEMLYAQRGHAFDPQIVDVFFEHAAHLLRVRDVAAHSGMSMAQMMEAL